MYAVHHKNTSRAYNDTMKHYVALTGPNSLLVTHKRYKPLENDCDPPGSSCPSSASFSQKPFPFFAGMVVVGVSIAHFTGIRQVWDSRFKCPKSTSWEDGIAHTAA